MTIDWATLGYNILTVFLLLLVISGAMPVITTLVLFLAIPFHGSINNYRKSAPYLPRVAVLVPAWNEEAVIGATIDRFMSLEYPRARLRVYVIDDASTDATADVVEDRAVRLVADGADHRREHRRHRPDETLVGEGQQVLQRATSARHDDHVDLGVRFQVDERGLDLRDR